MTQKTKRVCYLAPDVPIPSPRGSSVHIIELSRNLALLGHDVHVICRRTQPSEPKTEKIQNFTVHRISRKIFGGGSKPRVSYQKESASSSINKVYYLYLVSLYRIFVAFTALRLIRKYKLECIIERETSFGAGAIASFLSRKPMILEIIGPRYSRTSVWRSKTVLYYTESMLRSWVDRKKCLAVPAGVNLDLFRIDNVARETLRADLNVRAHQLVIGYVGTFQSWHGIDTLIEAFQRVVRSHPDLRLLLVGQNYEPFRKISERANVANLCTFVGAVKYEEVPGYINACDIMTALYEPLKDPLRAKYGIGWPLKILEYMACGKPTISTNVEPVPRIISDDALGFTVAPGDVGQLASLIDALCSDRSKLAEIAEHSRCLVQEKYSWESFARMVSKLL